ncbi:MAG TPA: 5-oxoprolinase subunit PxpA [Flavitalea sp.]|nr:5-oxoprolinase subunit PxpA [Flavitalea sp.]
MPSFMTIHDLNCDMGEGMPYDDQILPFITSANIACGFHAGDDDTMKRTVEHCLQEGVLIGAHPSYPDRENFGRVDMMYKQLRPADLPEIIVTQLSRLKRICEEAGTFLHHVKPHGALYNRAATDATVSEMICSAIKDVDENLILYGLHNSEMTRTALYFDMVFLNEVFADRTYQDNGTLTSRTDKNALLTDVGAVIRQVTSMTRDKIVETVSGKRIPVVADTICIHSDSEHVLVFARAISQYFKEAV